MQPHADTLNHVHLQHPFEYAFHLNSHAGLQGTSRPTHYHVLADENRFPPNDLVQLSYRQDAAKMRCLLCAACHRRYQAVS
jgi:hypothetical protein